MRDKYFTELYKIFKTDPNTVMLTADYGYKALDDIANDFSNRFYNVGIAEQHLIGMASGLAKEGFTVYCCGIAAFLVTRALEFIKLDVCLEKLPIHLIGIGAPLTYAAGGPTHHSTEDINLLLTLPNINIYTPSNIKYIDKLIHKIHTDKNPSYIRIDKDCISSEFGIENIDDGFCISNKKTYDSCYITNTIISKRLQEAEATLIDIFSIRPLNIKKLDNILKEYKNITVLEENITTTGFGNYLKQIVNNYTSLKINTLGITDFVKACNRDIAWDAIYRSR